MTHGLTCALPRCCRTFLCLLTTMTHGLTCVLFLLLQNVPVPVCRRVQPSTASGLGVGEHLRGQDGGRQRGQVSHPSELTACLTGLCPWRQVTLKCMVERSVSVWTFVFKDVVYRSVSVQMFVLYDWQICIHAVVYVTVSGWRVCIYADICLEVHSWQCCIYADIHVAWLTSLFMWTSMLLVLQRCQSSIILVKSGVIWPQYYCYG